MKDQELAAAYHGAQQVGIVVTNILSENGELTPYLAYLHAKAREVETVARAVARRRTTDGGHHCLKKGMGASPKKVNRHLGSKSQK